MYQEYISEPLNPKTGFSNYLNIDHYKSDLDYKDKLPRPVPKNRIMLILHKEIMSLACYGVSPAITRKILGVWKSELKNIARPAFATYYQRCCIYYSLRLKELKKLVGNYQDYAEQLIDFYETNKNKSSLEYTYLNKPINISTAVIDIRALIERLLMYTSAQLPEYKDLKELNKAEKEIKEKIMNCSNLEIMNDYYSRLVSILAQKEEYKMKQANSESYKAISCLKDIGFVEAAYRWLNCFPK